MFKFFRFQNKSIPKLLVLWNKKMWTKFYHHQLEYYSIVKIKFRVRILKTLNEFTQRLHNLECYACVLSAFKISLNYSNLLMTAGCIAESMLLLHRIWKVIRKRTNIVRYHIHMSNHYGVLQKLSFDIAPTNKWWSSTNNLRSVLYLGRS